MTAFRFPVRVYYEDTDAGGIVYHANYLKFAERARTEFVRGLGVSQEEMLDGGRGHAFAVQHLDIDFIRPARLDDALVVESEIIGIGGASMEVSQLIRREADGAELARLTVRVAFISLDGRPARIPAHLRASLRKLVSERR